MSTTRHLPLAMTYVKWEKAWGVLRSPAGGDAPPPIGGGVYTFGEGIGRIPLKHSMVERGWGRIGLGWYRYHVLWMFDAGNAGCQCFKWGGQAMRLWGKMGVALDASCCSAQRKHT